MSDLNSIIFYQMDRAIRSYRHLAQARFKSLGIDVTVDQWIIMKTLEGNPQATQMDLAEKVFKDNASVTRIINLLVENGYILREMSKKDRRRMDLKISSKGKKIMDLMEPIILENREIALQGLNKDEIEMVKGFMQRISQNCQNFSE